jgi:glycosyltransferase involved in cell wall biosynthesis
MLTSKEIIVAIPALNAGKTLEKVLAEVSMHVARNQIVVVNDGSSDDTAARAERWGVVLLNHEKNFGKGAALKTAFAYVLRRTAAQALITLDADSQHAPREIPLFVQAFYQDACDLVIGARKFARGVMPVMRIMSNFLTSKLIGWKVKRPIQDSQSGYRLYSRRLLQALQLQTCGYETESEVLFQACRSGMRLSFVPISTIYNGETSHIRGLRDVLKFLRLYIKS